MRFSSQALSAFTKQARLQSLACFIVCCLFELSFCLDRDVAIRAVDDAARIKIPRVVCHSLDRRFVLAGEGYTRQHATINECRLPDACHTIADRYTCKSATIVERIISNARHTRWDRHRCQADAPIKHILSNACKTIWNHHTCKNVA